MTAKHTYRVTALVNGRKRTVTVEASDRVRAQTAAQNRLRAKGGLPVIQSIVLLETR